MFRLSFLSCIVSLFSISHSAVSSTLYGLDRNARLVKVDPNTGNMTAIGKPVVTHELQGENLASLDSKNGIFYFVGTNASSQKIALVGLSIKDGSIVSETTLPFVSEAFVGVGQICDVDPMNGDVFVMGRDPAVNGDHHVLRVTPSTKKWKSLAHFALIDVLGGGHGYDPINDVLWIQMALNDTNKVSIRLYGFDGTSGIQLIEMPDVQYFEDLNFDPKTNLMTGLGLDIVTKTRFLATLDSSTGQFMRHADVPGFFIAAPMRTFDVKNRLLYAWLEPKNGPQNQVNMVEVNVDTKKVVQAPVACASLPDCPWSVDCLNL